MRWADSPPLPRRLPRPADEGIGPRLLLGLPGPRPVGAIVVARRVATDVVAVFRQLWESRFPLRRLSRCPPTAAATTSTRATTRPVSTAASSAGRAAGRCTPTARRSTSTQSRTRTQGARLAAAGRAFVDRDPTARNGGADGVLGGGLHLGRLEVGRGLRRLPALLDDVDADRCARTGLRRPRGHRGALPRAPVGGADAAGARARPAGAIRRRATACSTRRPRSTTRTSDPGRPRAGPAASPARDRPRRCLCSSGRSRRLSKRARSGSRRRGAHGRAGGGRPRRLRRLDQPRASSSPSARRRRPTGQPAPRTTSAGRTSTQPSTKRRSPSSSGRSVRERDPENAAAIEHAREAVAEARKALGR